MDRAKIILIIVLIVAGIALAIYFVGKSAGKKKTPKDVKLPSGGQGIPAAGVDARGNIIPWSAGPLADDTFDVLDGIDSSQSKEIVIAKLMAITDDQLVAVFNEFNRKHYDKGDGTMKKWIKDDSFAFNSVQPQLLARMDRLGLKDE
jgi:hypothetical protein